MINQRYQFAIRVSIPGNAGGLGALEDVLVLMPLLLAAAGTPPKPSPQPTARC